MKLTRLEQIELWYELGLITDSQKAKLIIEAVYEKIINDEYEEDEYEAMIHKSRKELTEEDK